MTTPDAAIKWCKTGIGGKFLGSFPTASIYGGDSIAEVYFINCDKLVGVRYPDNSCMAIPDAWLRNYKPPEIVAAFEKERWAWRKATKWRAELKLKHRGPKRKKGLRLKNAAPRVETPAPVTGAKADATGSKVTEPVGAAPKKLKLKLKAPAKPQLKFKK